jgi:K+/H+ antiporter YhaU regulatory subunit KhtT
VIANLREPEPIIGAQPSNTIERGDTLVTVGNAGQYPEFWLLSRGDSPGSAKESSGPGV